MTEFRGGGRGRPIRPPPPLLPQAKTQQRSRRGSLRLILLGMPQWARSPSAELHDSARIGDGPPAGGLRHCQMMIAAVMLFPAPRRIATGIETGGQ